MSGFCSTCRHWGEAGDTEERRPCRVLRPEVQQHRIHQRLGQEVRGSGDPIRVALPAYPHTLGTDRCGQHAERFPGDP